ncbi:hypothetical protein MRX96_038320 [Rhipicephalus microplus]
MRELKPVIQRTPMLYDIWSVNSGAEDKKEEKHTMNNVVSGLAAPRNSYLLKTRESSKSKDSSERRQQKSQEEVTPRAAAGVRASLVASAEAVVPASTLIFSSPNSAPEHQANITMTGRHKVIPSKQHRGPPPLDQQNKSPSTTQSSRPSETESKRAATPNDSHVPLQSNPLLALIHRASPPNMPSISTTSCGGGGTESVKLQVKATQTSDRPNNVRVSVPENGVTGAGTMLLQGMGRNATDVGHALPRPSMPRNAIVRTTPCGATSEKQGECDRV